MQRILRDNRWMIVSIGVFVLIVTVAKAGWGQEPARSPTTKNDQIENLSIVVEGCDQQVLDSMRAQMRLNIRIARLGRNVKRLEALLIRANARVAKLEGQLKQLNSKEKVKGEKKGR
ncbi:hypothetical protein LCGC14_1165130 [marine sediment metagenome]|uniref:Uncharacterized protein n=1 Tax=marine sediment metagenome TaxID=412755 RepID=A0A0F9P9N9_9ZZZZ